MGTRAITAEYNPINKDHPHAYGDKSVNKCNSVPPQGSSPRVWGQDFLSTLQRYWDRIIPTRMGTSETLAHLYYTPQDHPHAYGDKRKITLR